MIAGNFRYVFIGLLLLVGLLTFAGTSASGVDAVSYTHLTLPTKA